MVLDGAGAVVLPSPVSRLGIAEHANCACDQASQSRGRRSTSPRNTALLSLLFAVASLFHPLTPAVHDPVPGDGLPAKTPASVGMSAARLANIDRVVERGISAGGYP